MHAGITHDSSVDMRKVASDLQARDVRHLWHPYTDTNAYASSHFRCVDRAEGSYLYEMGGRPILDGIASRWATALGHGHPAMVVARRGCCNTASSGG